MQQWEGLAGAVQLGAVDHHKPHSEIEPYGLRVLLVDINQRGAKRGDSVRYQMPSYAPAAPVGVDEQHLDHVSGHAHKADDLAGAIAHADQMRRLGQLFLQGGFEELDVRLGQEVMGRADRSFPDLQDAGQIGGMYRPDLRKWLQLIIHLTLESVEQRAVSAEV